MAWWVNGAGARVAWWVNGAGALAACPTHKRVSGRTCAVTLARMPDGEPTSNSIGECDAQWQDVHAAAGHITTQIASAVALLCIMCRPRSGSAAQKHVVWSPAGAEGGESSSAASQKMIAPGVGPPVRGTGLGEFTKAVAYVAEQCPVTQIRQFLAKGCQCIERFEDLGEPSLRR